MSWVRSVAKVGAVANTDLRASFGLMAHATGLGSTSVLGIVFIALSAGCSGTSIAGSGGADPGGGLAGLDAGTDVKLRPYVPKPDARPAEDASPLPSYHEDACPDVPLPDAEVLCDPLARGQCPAGYACYPFPPDGIDPCHPGPYRMMCAEEGSGSQGAACGSALDGCQAGYICAVTGQGDQCIALCHPGAIGACANGMVCERLDIPGFGGCL
jgi:hypothetical protein